MTSWTPERIELDARALTVLERRLRSAAPDEGCALLIGRRIDALWRLLWAWPCRNVWQPREERARRFALDPRQQLRAQKWARRQGAEVLAAAHSHPTGLAIPSAVDRELTPLPSLMLILGRDGLACWWLAAPDQEPKPVPWRPVDLGGPRRPSLQAPA